MPTTATKVNDFGPESFLVRLHEGGFSMLKRRFILAVMPLAVVLLALLSQHLVAVTLAMSTMCLAGASLLPVAHVRMTGPRLKG